MILPAQLNIYIYNFKVHVIHFLMLFAKQGCVRVNLEDNFLTSKLTVKLAL